MSMKNLDDIFKHMLEDIYYAESKVVSSLPKMQEAATDKKLKDALSAHLEETKGQVKKLDQVFKLLGLEAKGTKCAAMDGLVKEADDVVKDCKDAQIRDVAIIAMCQGIEHYEIARYGTMIAFVKELGKLDAVAILQSILDEEYAADKSLNNLAEWRLNKKAA